MVGRPLQSSFFEQSVDQVAARLVGCHLVSELGGRTSGRIVETEAYGMDEEAFFGRHVRPSPSGNIETSSTGEVLRGARGVAFIYNVFFGNWLLNVVAGPPGYLGCVLLRAAEPIDGVDLMRSRRHSEADETKLASGPGRLTQAFGVTGVLNGHALQVPPLLLYPDPRASRRHSVSVVSGPRVGLKRARELHWRFVDGQSRSLSRPVPRIADREGDT